MDTSARYSDARSESFNTSESHISKHSSVNSEKERQQEAAREERIRIWKTTEDYIRLPEKTKAIVERSMRHQKHSAFYLKLNEMNEKIELFTHDPKPRVPFYEVAFKIRQ